MNETDKLIKRKYDEFDNKGELDNNSLLYYVRRSAYYKFMGWFGVIIGVGAAQVVISDGGGINAIFPLIMFGGGGGYMIRKAKYGARLYKLIDAYREGLIDRGLRSIADFSTLTGSNPDEIVGELKELQVGGFFRQFSIDRKSKKFIENPGWGGLNSSRLKQVAFACPLCGANNTIYNEENSTVGTCEYCGSSVNV